MIELEHISYAYGRHQVLKDVSFTAQAGQCVGILGNNGAGKSTLITCINRIRRPDSGDVRINGRSAFDMGRNELAQNVAYVSQKNELSQMTVFDCILLGRKPYMKWGASQEDIDICRNMVDRLGLEDFQLRSLDELSGGELQKVMLARALVQQPSVLLLDEPTSNLDPRNQHEMLALVREFAEERGITVLIVIHDLNLALRYCDRFYFLKDGTGYCYGGTEIINQDTIEDVYGISARVIQVEEQKVVIIG